MHKGVGGASHSRKKIKSAKITVDVGETAPGTQKITTEFLDISHDFLLV